MNKKHRFYYESTTVFLLFTILVQIMFGQVLTSTVKLFEFWTHWIFNSITKQTTTK